MENAHEAMADVEATHDVFMAQLEKYADTQIENKKGELITPVLNDMDHLHITSQRHRNVDMLGRIVYNDKDEEIFNFGKHRGKTVKEVLQTEPGYYGWMLNGDFPLYTKKVLKDIKERLSYEQ